MADIPLPESLRRLARSRGIDPARHKDAASLLAALGAGPDMPPDLTHALDDAARAVAAAEKALHTDATAPDAPGDER